MLVYRGKMLFPQINMEMQRYDVDLEYCGSCFQPRIIRCAFERPRALLSNKI